MKRILPNIFIPLLILCISCNQTTEQKRKAKTSIEKEPKRLKKAQDLNKALDFLKNMHGKYPHEVKLLDNTVVKQRLKKLLGNRFTFLMETWAVESPIELQNNIFTAWACEQHNCGATNFIIVIDLLKNVIYVGIREAGHVETYSEAAVPSPKQLQKWLKE